MSKLGQELLRTVKRAKNEGLVILPPSLDIAQLRNDLGISQSEFARIYRLNPETLKKWEQGKRKPDSISRAYLKCIAKAPKTVARLVNAN